MHSKWQRFDKLVPNRVRRRINGEADKLLDMAARACVVSFVDVRGIRHSAEVEAESLYEAAVLGIRRLNQDPWIERVGPATQLDVEVREPGTCHRISVQQVERWLAGATANPAEATRKAKLKTILVKS